MLNILDVCTILVIISGAIIGFKRGVIKQGVMTIGLYIVLILSFLLKNPISAFMYKYLPFFGFDFIIKNATVLNILVYEVLAFLIAFSILEIILVVLIKISSIIEKILKVTVIFAIPSKILGAILGAFEYYLLMFVILFVITQPTFKLNNEDFVRDSKLKPVILNNTIALSGMAKSTIDTFDEISELISDSEKMNSKDFNCKALKTMIKKDFLKEDSAKYLYESKKINTKCGIGE